MIDNLSEREALESRIQKLDLGTKILPVGLIVLGIFSYITLGDDPQVMFTTSITGDVKLYQLILASFLLDYVVCMVVFRNLIAQTRRQIEAIGYTN